MCRLAKAMARDLKSSVFARPLNGKNTIDDENLPNYLSLMFPLKPPESEPPDDLKTAVRSTNTIINIPEIVERFDI